MGRPMLLLGSALLAMVVGSSTGSPPIDWDKITPRYPTFTPRSPGSPLPQDLLRSLVSLGPPSSERFPGYKKGTKSMAGECGVVGSVHDSRIVNGYEATPHSFPWMAALFVDDTWFCGGTLISDEWVLTAAHCAKDASTMVVMLGAHNVREATEEGRLELTTTDFFTHPDYNTFTLHNDLALVHLPQPVNFTDIIRPICLPGHSEAGTAWAGEAAIASGWGKPSDASDSISPELRWVDTDTITNTACFFEFPSVINKNIICISGAHGKSTCNGDSGGPLYLGIQGEVGTTENPYKQIGITSFGISLGCELGFHAGFTRTASFLEWIETNTNLAIDP